MEMFDLQETGNSPVKGKYMQHRRAACPNGRQRLFPILLIVMIGDTASNWFGVFSVSFFFFLKHTQLWISMRRMHWNSTWCDLHVGRRHLVQHAAGSHEKTANVQRFVQKEPSLNYRSTIAHLLRARLRGLSRVSSFGVLPSGIKLFIRRLRLVFVNITIRGLRCSVTMFKN